MKKTARISRVQAGVATRPFRPLPVLVLLLWSVGAVAQAPQLSRELHYTVSFPQPASHAYHVTLRGDGWNADTLRFKMPAWEPGYYQVMDYARSVAGMAATDDTGRRLPLVRDADNAWTVSDIGKRSFVLSYDITTETQFVANSYVDEAHAYLIPENSFVYVDDYLDLPVSVDLLPDSGWADIATGLDSVPGKPRRFTAPDFDILYDCPILIGNLDALESFRVGGVEHRFVGYQLGTFDSAVFIGRLRKIVTAASAIIGDIPYRSYTFIGIGPGKGGIEHLNNATVTFDGGTLGKPGAEEKALLFLAHEYFHNYNVKRIRPFELGPFDYDGGSRTNLLWISEGLTVYYEYLSASRAGLADEHTLLGYFENLINKTESNPGRHYQSLQQASYNTWKDGPFGNSGEDPGKAISYYTKGPVVGLFLDFAIRNATGNRKSLDDVMRYLYRHYYQERKRGFTDAEFQQACETIAGTSLTEVFEYVYTTRDLDYSTYLAYGGLELRSVAAATGEEPATRYSLVRVENPEPLQQSVFGAWTGHE